MIKIRSKRQCCGCGACFAACPRKCISIISDEEGFLYPTVNESDCVQCGLCEQVCPIKKAELHARNGIIEKAFCGYSSDFKLLKNSSSGGAFGEIARMFFKDNGIVFGAAFTDDFYSAVHVCISKNENLYRLQGAKYFQSETGSSFSEVKRFLDAGKYVLFSGTPCQIAGLKAFLRLDYINLVTVEIICHGVPSSTVWSEYLKLLERKYKGKVEKVSFRNKEKGWLDYSLKVEFSNGKKYSCLGSDNPYMKIFLNNYDLRPSCYECKFKNGNSGADITLADCWGIKTLDSSIYNKDGVSFICARTEKGLDVISKIDMSLKEIDFDSAIKYNLSYVNSANYPVERNDFFSDFYLLGVERTLKKYAPDNVIKKCFNSIKKRIKKFLA